MYQVNNLHIFYACQRCCSGGKPHEDDAIMFGGWSGVNKERKNSSTNIFLNG